ncbi:MAG: hypothetical protein Q4B26_07165 [Eubacteriales bacterium]|nr:hypothetical protein [Eubacteriales bacterium]
MTASTSLNAGYFAACVHEQVAEADCECPLYLEERVCAEPERISRV